MAYAIRSITLSLANRLSTCRLSRYVYIPEIVVVRIALDTTLGWWVSTVCIGGMHSDIPRKIRTSR